MRAGILVGLFGDDIELRHVGARFQQGRYLGADQPALEFELRRERLLVLVIGKQQKSPAQHANRQQGDAPGEEREAEAERDAH